MAEGLRYNRQHFERVIWLDPGKMTGWASLGSDMSFSSGQLDFFNLGHELESYARFHNNQLAVGYEQFIVTPSTVASDPEYSLEVIGLVKWIVYTYNCTMLAPVPSASRKLGMDGGKLQKLKWHKPGRVHANDAAAHLLAWLLREGKTPLPLVAELFPEE
jgi:hypothetical protein